MNPDVPAILAAFGYIFPEAILILAACALFLAGPGRLNRHSSGVIALCATVFALIAAWFGPRGTASVLSLDNLALFVMTLALAGGAILVLVVWNEVRDNVAAEYHACLLVIIAGLCITASANELITLFLALEMISIPTYVVLYLPGGGERGQEAALKYFLLSIFASALMLFGFSYLYGIAGTTHLPGLFHTLSSPGNEGMQSFTSVALLMIVAGLGFRITAVPFHSYAPDVYQGTSAGNAALLAFAPKVAGFTALLRVTGYVLSDGGSEPLALGSQTPMLFYVLAAATMSLGNLLALLQDNVKRLLAYSSVAHAGYMLIGLAVAPDLRGEYIAGGIDAMLFYLVAYSAMTTGTFTVLSCLSSPQRPVEHVDDLAGLSTSNPAVAALMAVFLFSLIGIPLTAGFAGKLLLFFGALGSPPPHDHPYLFKWLAVIGVINAAIAAWYYLRILAAMYLRPPIKPLERVCSWPALSALVLCAAATLIFGTALSEKLHDYANQCVSEAVISQASR